jgi:hypothetical protein
LVALVIGQSLGGRGSGAASSAPSSNTPLDRSGSGRPPDISSLSPSEAAVRLFDRVMRAHERGQQDTVQIFAPMAIAAYQMLGNLDADQRYDLGRIAAVAGDEALARAQADTILARNPTHLLGLILAASAPRIRRDAAAEREFQRRLVAAAPTERQKQLPEYTSHENDITLALGQANRP